MEKQKTVERLLLAVDLPEQINERLDACLMESVNPEIISSSILSEFSVHELERVISKLVALYKIAPDLLNMFWQRNSDACPLEATEAEQQEKEWSKWIYNATR